MTMPRPSMPRRRSGGAGRAAAAAAVAALAPSAVLGDGEAFTTNAVCRRNNCINPVFPGLEDLHLLEQEQWVCSSLQRVMESGGLSFCHGAVNYDPALRASGDVSDLRESVKQQDQAALSMFFYHLSGMGRDAFEYQDIQNADDCTKSIWRMVCYTYFPRSKLGCQEGMGTSYMRPCHSSCENYIRSCGVTCCDEGVQCVFSHKKKLPGNIVEVQHGYAPHDGPSSMCTGAARRSASPVALGAWLLAGLLSALAASSSSSSSPSSGAAPKPRRAAEASTSRRQSSSRSFLLDRVCGCAIIAILAVSLQGCNMDVPTHRVSNWRAEPDYLIEYAFVPPGQTARFALLNSCSMKDLAPTLQCSGRGVCRYWDEFHLQDTVAFCQCDRDWADPECTTRRKSQAAAFLLSVFLGPFGADQFYLGYPLTGTIKLLTLGGGGLWWIADFIRLGASPVSAASFMVAADLPHWVFVLFTVMLAMLIGFAVSFVTLRKHISERRKDVLLLQAEEEHRLAAAAKLFAHRSAGGGGGGGGGGGRAGDYGSMGTSGVPTTAGGPSRGPSGWSGPSR